MRQDVPLPVDIPMEVKCAALEDIVSKPESAQETNQPDAAHSAVDATPQPVQ